MQASSVVFTQEGSRGEEAGCSDMEAEGEHMADSEEAHASGGPRREQRASGERASERALDVPLSKARTCEPNVGS